MKILFFAKDAPFVNSGYGKCCREICTRLGRLGHDVVVFATVGNRSAFSIEWGGLRILPGLDDLFGEEVFAEHYHAEKADVYITQIDIWPLKKVPDFAREKLINWIPYVPIDFDPIPDWILDKLRPAVHVATMCTWAKTILDKEGFSTTAIHHGIDSNIYRITDTKAHLKAELGFPPDCYLIGMVQANQFLRKAFEEQLYGIQLFIKANPEKDIRLYFHTIPVLHDSWDVPSLLQYYGLDQISKLPNNYKGVIGFNEFEMARIYGAFDVLLECTNGEGFGLPVIEAQACGVPVIATDATALPELINYGAVVKVKHWMLMPSLLRKAIPDSEDIAQKLENVYKTKWNPKEISRMAQYCWDWDERIIPAWMWMLSNQEEKLNNLCVRRPDPSKEYRKIKQDLIRI